MSDTSDLKKQLKESDPEIQLTVEAMKSENLKLVKKILRLKAEKVTAKNEIALLEKEREENPAAKNLSDEELSLQLKALGSPLFCEECNKKLEPQLLCEECNRKKSNNIE